MKWLLTMVLVVSFSNVFALTEEEIAQYYKIQSPFIKGDTLYIHGKIDSHIYNYLAYEATALKNIKVIDLASFGGNAEWALSTAEKIRDLNITTRISDGQYCASSCVVLFSAGIKREAHVNSGLNIHATRLGEKYSPGFNGYCMMELEDGTSEFNENLKGCKSFLETWYARAYDLTLENFALMEKFGASEQLETDYFQMDKVENWYEDYNVVKTPNWHLTPAVAKSYNLVTDIINN